MSRSGQWQERRATTGITSRGSSGDDARDQQGPIDGEMTSVDNAYLRGLACIVFQNSEKPSLI